MLFQPLLYLCNPISPHATPKRQGSEAISVLKNLFETLSRLPELTGQHTAGSRGSLHFQFWAFITKSSARTRVQTASRHFSGDPVKPSHESKAAAGNPHVCKPEEESRDGKFNFSLSKTNDWNLCFHSEDYIITELTTSLYNHDLQLFSPL